MGLTIITTDLVLEISNTSNITERNQNVLQCYLYYRHLITKYCQ